jgi:hypothetical protein
LAVAGARVVDLEEELEDLAKADARGIEDHLDCLRVCAVIAVRACHKTTGSLAG